MDFVKFQDAKQLLIHFLVNQQLPKTRITQNLFKKYELCIQQQNPD